MVGRVAHAPDRHPAEEWFGNETFFIRRGDRVSTVTGGPAAMDFDPDVFADALVFFAGDLVVLAAPPVPTSLHPQSSSRRIAS